jgi:thiamine-phosphate pyrophosphorylase
MTRQWFIADSSMGKKVSAIIRRLPRGTGVLVLSDVEPRARQTLWAMARLRGLTIAVEGRRQAARVHNLRELRSALLARTPLILLSPIYPTGSHPEWRPLPRMRAAAMTRLAGRRLLALGGMDERRYRRVEHLGFVGWAGISGWLRT